MGFLHQRYNKKYKFYNGTTEWEASKKKHVSGCEPDVTGAAEATNLLRYTQRGHFNI